MPKIYKFTNEIEKNQKQIENFKEIIKQFDYNLSLKANKNLFKHSIDELKIEYMKKDESWEEIN